VQVLAGEGIFKVEAEAAAEAAHCANMGLPVPGGGEIEERLCEKVVERLLSDECQREGFVLIGFPRNANQLQVPAYHSIYIYKYIYIYIYNIYNI